MKLSFSDVLLTPNFSFIKSRKDVDTSVNFLGLKLKLGVISSNMDSVTGPEMAEAMSNYGALGCLHRFWTIQENVDAYLTSPKETMVSVGLGADELERAKALYKAGARRIVVDVSNGASEIVVKQTKALRTVLGNDFYLVVGNFATKQSILDFKAFLGKYKVDAWKIGIGGGSACTTRIVTGCGWPTLASILDCKDLPEPIIADGGIRGSADLSKGLAAGATVVMCGQLLAGTEESCAEGITKVTNILPGEPLNKITHKKYRGSASEISYEVQGKTAIHRVPEGETFLVPYSGSVASVLQKLEAGLRSSMSYLNSSDLISFRHNANFVQITQNGKKESEPHGKTN